MNKVEFSRTVKPAFAKRYGNFIGGKWVEPKSGRYFDNTSPVNGQVLCEIARSDAADIEAALDAAHAAKDAWGKTSAAERALILNRIADRIEENLPALAAAETWDNGKPIRETTNADLPLAIDHFRYFAGVIRAQEGGISKSITTRSPIIFMNRSVSSARSFPGTSRSSWRRGNLRPPLRQATASF